MLREGTSQPDERIVREQLDRILRSGQFLQSRRRQRFLQYIVTETLAGHGDRLKGYDIALKVFDRAEDFDPNVDPIVRIEAARLRDRLREYYEGDGHSDPVRIDLPKGTYTPKIELRQPEAGETEAPSPDDGAPLATADHATVRPTDALSASPSPRRSFEVPWQLGVAAAALVLLFAALAQWQMRGASPPVAGVEPDAGVHQPAGPAVAVLPFTNLSGDPKQDYFSDGLTEDILTELSRSSDLRVIARNTSFQYKGKAVDVTKLGRELKVNYVLEGSVQRSADRLRVTAQLIDAETGTHVWAERFDREMADLFVLQDEIVNQIAGKVAGSYGVIETVEAKSAARKNPDEIQAYDLVLRARAAREFDWTNETFAAARGLLYKAIEVDPSSVQAHRELAWTGLLGWIFRLEEKPLPPGEIVAQAAKAVQLEPSDARAHLVAASAYFFTKQLPLFEREADLALALAPYDAETVVALGCMISSAGDHVRGVALAEKAYALSPEAATGWYHSTVYTAAYLAGDYTRALEVANQNQDAEMFALRSRDHPDTGPARPQGGGGRRLPQAAGTDTGCQRGHLRGLVAAVELHGCRYRKDDGRSLQIGRAGSERRARPMTRGGSSVPHTSKPTHSMTQRRRRNRPLFEHARPQALLAGRYAAA